MIKVGFLKIIFLSWVLGLVSCVYAQQYKCLINDKDFDGIKSAILNISSEDDRSSTGVEIIKQTNCCFYSRQIYMVAQSFTNVADLKSFLEGVYNNIYDNKSDDFNKLISLFKYDNDMNSFQKLALAKKPACSDYTEELHKYSNHKDQDENIKELGNIDYHGHKDTLNSQISNLKVSNLIEWADPKTGTKSVHAFIRVKVKINTINIFEINIMHDKLIVQANPEKITRIDNTGFFYFYYLALHEGDNHVMIRLKTAPDQSYLYSKDLIINYVPE